jgi:hypothetical protein
MVKFRYFVHVILLLLFPLADTVAQDITPADSIPAENIPDSSPALKPDSTKTSAIDAPIDAHAKDSIIMTLDGKNMLYLFGTATVKQDARNLDAEYIEMDADSSLMYANYGLDSIGEKFGYPVFTEGDQHYEMEKVWFNFKTKKMLVEEVITQQGEGYLTSHKTKRMPNDEMYLENGKFTTCDEHEHPHWYFMVTRGKLRKGKNVIAGPTYLVVEDIPLPVFIPFGFFPFTKDYSSGILMPTFDDEMTRGFSLRDGGYYFAFNDYVDLALTGEIYTKGSWGVNASSSYLKKYKFSGSFDASYLVTITGDKDTKDLPDTDYAKQKDFRITWSHRQDTKANPFLNFSASVNFTTSTFNRNSISELYSTNFTDNNKSSTIQLTYKHPTKPFTITSNAAVSQTLRDTSLSVTLPNMTIAMSQIYPFKRKEQIGDALWYEKIYLSYTGVLKNSIERVKENEFLKKNIINDWQNGMTHAIPLSASFTAMKYISVNPSVNYNAYWYTQKVTQAYDETLNRLTPSDTLHGFYHVNNYSASISMNTKLYGMYKPLPVFGKWTRGMVIRHMVTPSVSFSGSPDFSDPRYGSYERVAHADPNNPENVLFDTYSFFQGQTGGGGSSGKSGSLRLSLDNNLEAKLPIADTDSTRKISIIDNFGISTNYNFLLDSLNWADKDVSVRFKLFGRPLSFSSRFETYKYNENGRKINKMRPGLGRFTGTQTGYSFSLNDKNVTRFFKKIFRIEKENDAEKSTKRVEVENETTSDMDYDENLDDDELLEDENPDETAMEDEHQHTSLRKKKKAEGEYDDDGYLIQSVPWNLSFNYSVGYRYGTFNPQKREYDYRLNQTLGFSGNITPAKGWTFNFNSSYDFDNKKFAYMQCSISRSMHCWTMTASFMPVGPYKSYNFSVAVKSSLLKDLKYQQSSNYRDSKTWE